MDIRRFMGPDEILRGSYGKNVYLTDMRVIYYTGRIDSFFKDMMLDSIDTITYTKRHYSWMVVLGILFFATSFLAAYLLEAFTFYIVTAGALICASLILSFVFLVDNQVILNGRSSKMELRGMGMSFIEDLRKECYNGQKSASREKKKR